MYRCSIASATLRGVEALSVQVEVSLTSGLPGISIVGMPDMAVQEARERVRAAIRASGYAMPRERIVVNLAPGDVRKTGVGFDLPIALGILIITGQIDSGCVKDSLVVGELSLEGTVRAVAGTLAYGLCAHRQGLRLLCSPESDLVPVAGLDQVFLHRLSALHERFNEDDFGFVGPSPRMCDRNRAVSPEKDFSDICGHELAKRALQIAAAGRHGVLMMGPPGSGKTMLASRMGGILPPLTQEEAIEAAVVHSVMGEPVEAILGGRRPFRSPHHSATVAGLVGGGTPIHPGEISLAHKGILFLDELPEFRSSVLQSIRQPMETGRISLIRAEGSVELPADFMLVAASNPCPCGYYGDAERHCTCTVAQIRQYQGRIGGPLMDRIDLHLDVRRTPPETVVRGGVGTSSRKLLEGVLSAREFASWRRSQAETSSLLDKPRAIVESCGLSEEDRVFLEGMAKAYQMSGRAIVRTLNVARTIADLEESRWVSSDHIAEALGYRLREGVGG